MTTARLTQLFRLDAVANLALAAAALALSLAPQVLGLPRPVLLLAAVALLANAIDLARTGRRTVPDAHAVRRSGAVDLAFAAGLMVVAVVGLDGQSGAARWALALVGDVSLLLGLLKLYGLRVTRTATA